MTNENAVRKQEKLDEMPVLEHFAELRRRFIRIVLAWAVGMVACFGFAPTLYSWLAEPIQRDLIFISPVEPFFIYVKLSLIASIFGTSPYSFWQVWRFIAPGLYAHERRRIVPIVLLSSLAFVGGAAFCYGVVLPLGLNALLSAGQTEEFTASAQITMQSYFSLVTRLMIAFGIVFEMPLFSILLTRLGVVDHRILMGHWRVAVVLIFITAALLTPPDVVTQVCLALPMCLLYGLSILLSYASGRRLTGSDMAGGAPAGD